nr:efflux RND transporter periplasmic adaptor subunit [uncultured Cohaesibacter sp.]
MLMVSVGHTQEGMEMPPAEVGVLTVSARVVSAMKELPGRVAATRSSEVRSRVSGILVDRVFEQGTLVKQGDVLYRVDPKVFAVRVASARAALRKAEATRDNAKTQFGRQSTLRERNVSSAVDLDTAAVGLAQAEADVNLARAALDEAEINLDYTEIRAPITGVIGAALVTEGALVTADGSASLALIQQIDPVYVDFTQSAEELFALRRAERSDKPDTLISGKSGVDLVIGEGAVFDHRGKLLFSSTSVDATTGQVTLRAEFPNPDGELLPGMYVRVRITQTLPAKTLSVPQRAVLRSDDGKAQLYVVGNDGTASLRDVELGPTQGQDWIVESGLSEGETIIVEGIQKVQPGSRLVPEPWTPNGQLRTQPDHALQTSAR